MQLLAELTLDPGLQITMDYPLFLPSVSPIQTHFLVRFEK